LDRDSGLNLISTRKAFGPDITAEKAREPAQSADHVPWSGARRELFHALYRTHFDFVYRNLRRLGVPAAMVDDALQDVYMVVLRRLDGFHEGTHARAWLFAIAMRVAANYRRALQRRGPPVALRENEPDKGLDSFESAARAHAALIVHTFLDRLDDDRRAVFVMAELEQMTAPEIASALSANVNTIYSRLRAARGEFEAMVAQLHGQTGGDHD
jgi:RNA polymerase sigma-70 factor (ECF subfamily)